jgi:hypothetical protein
MEYKGKTRSALGIVGIGVPCGVLRRIEYKDMDEMRTKIMEHVYIYGYISFTLRVLFLIGLILFTWVALRKIHQRPFW